MSAPDFIIKPLDDGSGEVVITLCMVLPALHAARLAAYAQECKLNAYMPPIVAALKKEFGFEDTHHDRP